MRLATPQIVAFDQDVLLEGHIHLVDDMKDLGAWGYRISSIIILIGDLRILRQHLVGAARQPGRRLHALRRHRPTTAADRKTGKAAPREVPREAIFEPMGRETLMNNIIYLVGLVVIVLAILAFLGLR